MHPRKDPSRRCLPPDFWPVHDRVAWDAAKRDGDILQAHGAVARFARHSIRNMEKGYGRWINWLSTKGRLDPGDLPAERVTPASVAEYIADLKTVNASSTVLAR